MSILMEKWTLYIRAVRPLNLLLIVGTQTILYNLVIHNYVTQAALNPLLAFLLSLTTCFIAASGYVINDIFDRDIDKINKANKAWIDIGATYGQAMIFYKMLVLSGFCLSLYIAWCTRNFHLLPIYPIACALLYYYAKNWKMMGYFGNNVVAFMTSFVTIIVMVAERKSLFNHFENTAFQLLFAFASFSYFINLIREITKDIEDMEGDQYYHSNSLPLTQGIPKSKVIIYFNTFILLVLLSAFVYGFKQSTIAIAFVVLFIFLPLIVTTLLLSKAENKAEFHNISNYQKYIMLSGLIYLIILSQKI